MDSNEQNLKAIILAGGKGTRLMPYTTVIPKPLMPIEDRAVLEYVLGWLRKSDVRDVVIAINHLAQLIQAVIGSGEEWGLNIQYSVEEEPLNTIGPLTLIDSLPDNFLVLNGDILTDLDIDDFYRYHLESDGILTVATIQRRETVDFGVLEFDADKRVNGFREKPEYTFNVSMGIYAMRHDILDHIPRNTPFGFDELILRLLDENEPIRVYPYKGEWLDIGRPEDYELANSPRYSSLLQRMLR